MEIIFDNVTYAENINTLLEKTYLESVSFSIKENKVYALMGDSISGIEKIPELINAVRKPTKGKVVIGNFINNGKYIKNVNKLRFNVGFIKLDPDSMLFNKTVKKELSFAIKHFKYKLDKEHIRVDEALKLVGLNETYLNKKISELNINEKKKISIASTLIYNPSIIIFEEPTIFMSYNDILELKKLIRILKTRYNKTILIITKDASFGYEVADKFLIFNKGKLINSSEELQDEKILNNSNITVPEIIKFINIANKKDANLTYTNNILDLIKEVYRNARL